MHGLFYNFSLIEFLVMPGLHQAKCDKNSIQLNMPFSEDARLIHAVPRLIESGAECHRSRAQSYLALGKDYSPRWA
jgi:hypothetical protein